MRLILSLLTFSGFGFGGWYAWDNFPPVREFVLEKIQSNAFSTLEIRYTAQELMRLNEEELLKNSGYSYLEPELLYYPYLLMNVKYSKDRSSTTEGILLWGLNDGEMVVNTTTWAKTHGFEDCLLSKASKNDFKIIQALVEKGGAVDREKLYLHFKVDQDLIDDWIDSCRAKKLIVVSGNKFRLHFENPRLEIEPITHFDQAIVSKPTPFANKVKSLYSASQIQKLTQIVFGGDFAIRKSQEIYLPVYSIAVQNPDGSTRTLYFNALTGKSTPQSF